ncbi:MAG: hypothetical protein HY840_11060 [Bacteroidetes bacterium]|nr:hypothetical protein [Bacteroidota bacterium]
MKLFIWIVSVLGLMFFASCQNKNIEQKIAQTDSLLSVVARVKEKIKNTEFDEYEIIYTKVKTIDGCFKKLTADFPKDQDFRNKFAMYSSIEKTYKRIFYNYNKLKEDIPFTEKQFNDLKSDLQSGALKDETKINTYYNQEKNVTERLKNNLDEILGDAADQKELYEKVKEDVEKFAEALQAKNQK